MCSHMVVLQKGTRIFHVFIFLECEMMAGLCILPHLLKGTRKDIGQKFVIHVTVIMTLMLQPLELMEAEIFVAVFFFLICSENFICTAVTVVLKHNLHIKGGEDDVVNS